LLDAAGQRGALSAELKRFRAWLPAGRISRKQEDALALLATLGDFLASDRPRLVVDYRFEHTETWDTDITFAAPLGLAAEFGVSLRRELLLDELRLCCDERASLQSEALAMALSRREAERSHITVTAVEIATFRRRWLDRRGLRDPDALAAWCRRNGLEGGTFDDFIATRAREHRIAAMARDLIDDSLTDALRLRGSYVALAERALAKQRALVEAGAVDLSLAESGLSAFDLLAWFCENRLRRPLPTDVEEFAAELAFPSAETLYRALLRERLYLGIANIDNTTAEDE
jgi:hypothetical protein